ARLTRRGVELSAGLLAVVIADASRAVSPMLIRAASHLASGGAPSATVAAMAGSISAGLTAGHAKIVTGLLLAVGVLAGAVAGLTETGPGSLTPATVAGATAAEPRGERLSAPARPAAAADSESFA